jgi:hypothetical protein
MPIVLPKKHSEEEKRQNAVTETWAGAGTDEIGAMDAVVTRGGVDLAGLVIGPGRLEVVEIMITDLLSVIPTFPTTHEGDALGLLVILVAGDVAPRGPLLRLKTGLPSPNAGRGHALGGDPRQGVPHNRQTAAGSQLRLPEVFLHRGIGNRLETRPTARRETPDLVAGVQLGATTGPAAGEMGLPTICRKPQALAANVAVAVLAPYLARDLRHGLALGLHRDRGPHRGLGRVVRLGEGGVHLRSRQVHDGGARCPALVVVREENRSTEEAWLKLVSDCC